MRHSWWRVRYTRTQRHMWASGIVMANPRLQEGPEMGFSQGNQPIEALSASGPDEPFANRVGRRTSRRRFQYFDPEFRDRLVEVCGKNAIAIMQQVFVPLLRSNRLTQLLQRPSRSRVRGYIAMNHAPTAMLDAMSGSCCRPELLS